MASDDGKITILLGEYKTKLQTLADLNHRSLTKQVKAMVDAEFTATFGTVEEQAAQLRKMFPKE